MSSYPDAASWCLQGTHMVSLLLRSSFPLIRAGDKVPVRTAPPPFRAPSCSPLPSSQSSLRPSSPRLLVSLSLPRCGSVRRPSPLPFLLPLNTRLVLCAMLPLTKHTHTQSAASPLCLPPPGPPLALSPLTVFLPQPGSFSLALSLSLSRPSSPGSQDA